MRTKRIYNNKFKAKVALEAVKGDKTLNELGKEYQVHPKVISGYVLR